MKKMIMLFAFVFSSSIFCADKASSKDLLLEKLRQASPAESDLFVAVQETSPDKLYALYKGRALFSRTWHLLSGSEDSLNESDEIVVGEYMDGGTVTVKFRDENGVIKQLAVLAHKLKWPANAFLTDDTFNFEKAQSRPDDAKVADILFPELRQ
jgi:hypothetical protein